MIVRSGGKYCVKSKSSGRSFGCYKSKGSAIKRLRQIEYFKKVKRK